MNKYLLFIFLYFSFHTNAHGQVLPSVFGKMKKSEYPTQKCPIDTSATAYYMFDQGVSAIMPTESNWEIKHTRYFRIKIDHERSISERDIIIWLQQDGEQGEKLIEMKAAIYNIVNNKWVITSYHPRIVDKSKLASKINFANTIKKDIVNMTSDPDRPGWKKVECRLPNVKKGSVIDVSYTIRSDLFSKFGGWQFQKNIPVLKSSYNTIIPEYFKYSSFVTHGSVLKTIEEKSYRSGYTFIDFMNHFQASDLQALRSIPYSNASQYIPKVSLEFSGFSSNGKWIDYTKTWNQIDHELMRDSAFGIQLYNCACFDSTAQSIAHNYTNDSLKILAAYSSVKNAITWNHETGFWSEFPIDSVYKYKLGNAAEINLAFICLINKLGIPAWPLVLNTKDKGLAYKELPSLKWFDYLIADVSFNGRRWYIDVADPIATPQIIPTPLIYTFGKTIDTLAINDIWTQLHPNGYAHSHIQYQITLDAEKGLKGSYQSKDQHYAAYDKRMEIFDAVSQQRYVENLNVTHPAISMYDFTINNKEDTKKEFLSSGTVVLTNQFIKYKDTISWIPLQYERILQNPFANRPADIPVELSYPSIQLVNMEIQIPQNVELLEIPKSIRISNEDGSLLFIYRSEQTQNKLKLSTNLSIHRHQFDVLENQSIKEFFDRVIGKQAEKIKFKIKK